MDKSTRDMPTKQFVEEELTKIDKKIKWAERKSRWETILWIAAVTASVVFVGFGLRNAAFNLLFISILIMVFIKSELSFIEGFFAGKYYMSVKKTIDNNTNIKGGEEENENEN